MKRASRWRPALLGLGVAFLASMVVAQAADAATIRLYRDANFQGPSQTYTGHVNNLSSSGFNDEFSSARVLSGAWQLCEDKNYQDKCRTISHDVANLGTIGLNNSVSSLRPVGGGYGDNDGGYWGDEDGGYWGDNNDGDDNGGYWGDNDGDDNGGYWGDNDNNQWDEDGNFGGGWSNSGSWNRGVTLFANRNYSGKRRNFTSADNNLRRSGLNNRVSSIRVMSGRWLLCTGANYTGDCLTFSRNVPNLGAYGINNNVSSLRPVTGNPWGGNWWSSNPWRGTWFGFAFSNRRPNRGDLVIFEDAGYRGRWAVLDHSVNNLRRTGLNDQISSVSVRDGVWKLCARANYRGRCITISDDVYNLRGIFNDRITSVQRIR